MKKIFGVLMVLSFAAVDAQFTVNVQTEGTFTPREAYFYKLDGSKDILISKQEKKGDRWSLKVDEPYRGMMKAYFPESNYTVNFISENKDVSIKMNAANNRVSEVVYLDESNKVMDEMQDRQMKREKLLPAFYELIQFYKPSQPFYTAVEKEIENLSRNYTVDATKFPFVDYYSKNYNKFLVTEAVKQQPSQQEIISFISNTNEMLETSSLLRPILISYLNSSQNTNMDVSVDNLLKAVNVESPRGQTVLSELIEIFDAYGMTGLKDKYLSQAKNLKCTIFSRLASTLETSAKTEIGSTFENQQFVSPKNTTAKSLYDVKADKKVVVFWSSGCSHCERDLPQFIPHYTAMKAKNIEIIGFSLDSEKAAFERAANNYPWINDTELRGWNSTYGDKYNVHATPTYFILDSNNKILDKPNHVNDVFEYLGLK